MRGKAGDFYQGRLDPTLILRVMVYICTYIYLEEVSRRFRLFFHASSTSFIVFLHRLWSFCSPYFLLTCLILPNSCQYTHSAICEA